MRAITCLAVVFAGVLGWGARSAAQTPERVLVLSFDADGRVNLRAQNVTPREILAEWGRFCQCHVVNAEGLRGEAVTVPLLFEHQPQSAVLGSLLRQAAGYVLTPRRAGATGPSAYETIYIVATSNPSSTAYSGASAPMPPPPMPTRGSPENEIPPVQEITGQPAAATPPPGQQPATYKPAAPGTGLPTSSVFVPIVAVPSSPFATTPNRAGGPGTPTTPPPAGTPGQAPATQPRAVGANP